MKKCPNCSQVFTDDNSFCLNDGTTLIIVSQANEHLPIFPTPENAPTQIISHSPPPQPVTDSSKWLYLIIGVMATAILALGTAFYLSRTSDETITSGKSTEETANKADDEKSTGTQNPLSTENRQSQTAVNSTNTAFSTSPPQPSINPNLNPGGRWSGDWNSKTTYFTAELNLTDNGANTYSGEIYWHLRRTTNPKKIDKVGLTATEYVRGTYNPETRTLNLSGYRKDDPSNIVVLDKYNLSLAENNQRLIGGSKTNGRFVLNR